MSAFGPKQTWASALHMSAFGGKADMAIALRNDAYDPKADITEPFHYRYLTRYHRPEIGGADEAARVHNIGGSCGGCPATRRTGTTASKAQAWVFHAHRRSECQHSPYCRSQGTTRIRRY